jgi:hypothetical protein
MDITSRSEDINLQKLVMLVMSLEADSEAVCLSAESVMPHMRKIELLNSEAWVSLTNSLLPENNNQKNL